MLVDAFVAPWKTQIFALATATHIATSVSVCLNLADIHNCLGVT